MAISGDWTIRTKESCTRTPVATRSPIGSQLAQTYLMKRPNVISTYPETVVDIKQLLTVKPLLHRLLLIRIFEYRKFHAR
jgi:hypothetical protein